MSRLKDKIVKLKEEIQLHEKLEVQMRAAPGQQISLTDPGSHSTADRKSHHVFHVQSDWRVSSRSGPVVVAALTPQRLLRTPVGDTKVTEPRNLCVFVLYPRNMCQCRG